MKTINIILFIFLLEVLLLSCHKQGSTPIIGKWNFSHYDIDLSTNNKEKDQKIKEYTWDRLNQYKRESWEFQKDGQFIDNESYIGKYKYEGTEYEGSIYTYMTYLGGVQDSLAYTVRINGDTLIFYKDYSTIYSDPSLRRELDIDDVRINKAMIYSYFVRE